MRRVRSKDTSIERKVRSALHGLGFRFRLHRKDLPGKPDIVLPKYRAAVFIDGCFWHGHDCARGSRIPETNRDYWVAKIERNRTRDAVSRASLEALGWRVIQVWECQLKDVESAALSLASRIRPEDGRSGP
jgi:DNA mismatch endonuclease (patch repair protein)